MDQENRPVMLHSANSPTGAVQFTYNPADQPPYRCLQLKKGRVVEERAAMDPSKLHSTYLYFVEAIGLALASWAAAELATEIEAHMVEAHKRKSEQK